MSHPTKDPKAKAFELAREWCEQLGPSHPVNSFLQAAMSPKEQHNWASAKGRQEIREACFEDLSSPKLPAKGENPEIVRTAASKSAER